MTLSVTPAFLRSSSSSVIKSNGLPCFLILVTINSSEYPPWDILTTSSTVRVPPLFGGWALFNRSGETINTAESTIESGSDWRPIMKGPSLRLDQNRRSCKRDELRCKVA